MQEVLTLLVFFAFAWLWLGETPRWNHGVAMVLIAAAVVFAFWPAAGALAAPNNP